MDYSCRRIGRTVQNEKAAERSKVNGKPGRANRSPWFCTHTESGVQIVDYLTVEECTKGFPRGEAVANRLFETDL